MRLLQYFLVVLAVKETNIGVIIYKLYLNNKINQMTSSSKEASGYTIEQLVKTCGYCFGSYLFYYLFIGILTYPSIKRCVKKDTIFLCNWHLRISVIKG